MGITLQNKFINETYPGIIKFSDNLGSVGTTLKQLSDGNGVDLPISVSTNTIKFLSNIDITQATFINPQWPTISEFNTLDSTLSSALSDISQLQDDVDAVESLTITNIGNIAQLQSNLNSATASILDNANDIIQLQSDISSATASILNIENDILNLESELASATASILNIENDINNIEIDLASATASILNNANDILNLESNLASATASILDNSNDILDIQNGINNVLSLQGLTGSITFNEGTHININVETDNSITISSSGGGGAGIDWSTSGLDGYVATYKTNSTAEPESKLIFANSYLDILATNAVDGIRLFGGVYGASNPKISTTVGNLFNTIEFDRNILLKDQSKIAFDGDLLNTYIAADTDNPENLEIHADNNIQLFGNVEINDNLSVGTISDVEQAIIDLQNQPSGFSNVVQVLTGDLAIDNTNYADYVGKTIIMYSGIVELDPEPIVPAIGDEFYIIQGGGNQTQFSTYDGSVVSSVGTTPTTRVQWSSMAAKKISSTEWLVVGDIE